jgi:hypothetical protein
MSGTYKHTGYVIRSNAPGFLQVVETPGGERGVLVGDRYFSLNEVPKDNISPNVVDVRRIDSNAV